MFENKNIRNQKALNLFWIQYICLWPSCYIVLTYLIKFSAYMQVITMQQTIHLGNEHWFL